MVFTKNATESLNILLKGFLKPCDHVLVSSMEHNAVMRPLVQLSRQGVSFTRIPCAQDGQLLPESLPKLLKPQTAGTWPIHMEEMHIDALAFTGHKGLSGPQGIGGFLLRWDGLLRHWDRQAGQIIRLGASTIPSAYILPELLPAYGKEHPGTYFSIHQSNSQDIINRLLRGDFDMGLIGMESTEASLSCIPFYEDRMVIITPVNDNFLSLSQHEPFPLELLTRTPVMLREKHSGSRKSADRFLESLGSREENLQAAARINDQEAIKNLVAQGLGISILSERAARNFVNEKRVLVFQLPETAVRRSLYLIYPKHYMLSRSLQGFLNYILRFYSKDP